MVKALHSPAEAPQRGEDRSDAVPTTAERKITTSIAPEDLAAELLKSSDAKVAAAAKRIFSRPDSAKDAVNPAATLPAPQGPTAFASDAPATSTSTGDDVVPNMRSTGSNGSALKIQQQKSTAAQVGVTSASAADTTESSSAASTLAAMAAAATASFSSAIPASSTRGAGKKVTSSERLQRSRERNRMHARKTRQRKKEHMHCLQSRADELKKEQLRLKQAINEKNTASILLGMFATIDQKEVAGSAGPVDPKVEELMKRSADDIPDASKIPELPALILPGQHSSKKNKEDSSTGGNGAEASSSLPQHANVPDDGIDYELLGKDRSKCTPAELDHIRRERNRMHAKRTRDRKRIFMEEMEVMIKQIEGENKTLENHLASLNAGEKNTPKQSSSASTTPSLAPTSPALQPSTPRLGPETIGASTDQTITPSMEDKKPLESTPISTTTATEPTALLQTAEPKKKQRGITVDEIKSILSSAGALENNKEFSGILTISSVASAVSAHNSDDEHDGSSDLDRSESPRPTKRQCLMASPAVSASC